MENKLHNPCEYGRNRLAKRLAWSCVALLFVFGLTFAGCAWVAGQRFGVRGVWAAAVAVFVVSTAQLASLIFLAVAQHPRLAVQAALGATLLRMALTFPVGLLLCQQQPVLAKAGLFGLIVVCYLVGLLFETILAVRMFDGSASVAKVS